ncbi:DUF3596 domain-containing protein [Nostoc sp. NMS4]|uniref:Arm DNA-binding domain-containing protein n=1 Tax=Nostoc sp. NMS4 TaxID=2815390 RepID=UPI0034126291|nr:DUF3596 domain-containing protein [Nostoc sp. NMS4]
MPKAPAGTVHIECFRDRLRLRFTYNSKQHTLALKLADTPVNRKVAEGIASEISRDLLLKTPGSPIFSGVRRKTTQG